ARRAGRASARSGGEDASAGICPGFTAVMQAAVACGVGERWQSAVGASTASAGLLDCLVDRSGRDPAIVERLPVPHSPLDLDESEPRVSDVTLFVVEQRVRGELLETSFTRPCLDGLDQTASDAGAAAVEIDVPALEDRHRTRPTAVGVRASTRLGEAAQ